MWDFVILFAVVGFFVFLFYWLLKDEHKMNERHRNAWAATHADPRCASSIRILLSSGFTIAQMTSVRPCRYCEQPHRAFVHGPKKMETPAGEVFVHENVFHGTACLRCGFLSDGAGENETGGGEIRLLDFVERESVCITRDAYEAELDRLAMSAADVHQKLRQLPPANAYREPAKLPESAAILRKNG